SRAYHMPYGYRLKGKVNGGALRRALERIVERHEALRTTFETVEGEPRQRVRRKEESGFVLREQDLRGGGGEEELQRVVEEEANAGFDLEKGPLIRGRLIRVEEQEHVLLLTMHHIVSDGWSMGVLVKELGAIY